MSDGNYQCSITNVHAIRVDFYDGATNNGGLYCGAGVNHEWASVDASSINGGGDGDGDGGGGVTVTDDDAAPELSIEGASVPEGNTGTTPLTFTVTKHGRTDQRVTVAYAPGTGTATAGTDYTAVAAVVRQFELVAGLSGSSIRLPNSQCRSHMRIGKAPSRIRNPSGKT